MHGFTLIEIVMVLILLALLTAILLPRGGTRLQAPDAATEHAKALMIARLAHARTESLRSGRELTLTITDDGRKVQYGTSDEDRPTPLAGETPDGSHQVPLDKEYPAVSMQLVESTNGSASNTLSFLPDGIVRSSQHFHIRSEDGKHVSEFFINGGGYVDYVTQCGRETK